MIGGLFRGMEGFATLAQPSDADLTRRWWMAYLRGSDATWQSTEEFMLEWVKDLAALAQKSGTVLALVARTAFPHGENMMLLLMEEAVLEGKRRRSEAREEMVCLPPGSGGVSCRASDRRWLTRPR